MKKSIVLIMVFGVFFACFSQGGGEQGGGNRQGGGLKSVLNMTPQQEEAFRDARRESRSRDSLYFVRLEELRIALLDESAKEKVDLDKISKITDEIGKIHAALSHSMYEHIQKIKTVLTKEQFDNFIEYRKSKNIKNFQEKRGQIKQK